MDDLLAEFLTETNEGIAALDDALLRLERTPDDRTTLGEVFRLVHTIKGTCGFLGLPRLEAVAHAAETMLGRYRDGTLAVTPAGITLILGALDRIKLILAGLAASGAEPAGDDAALIAAIDAASQGEVAAALVAPVAINAPAAPEAPAAPATEEAAPPAEPGRQAAPPAENAPGTEPAAAGGAPQTIRVGVDVLEHLMTLVSELVLTRNQLLQLARSESGSSFATPLQRLSQLTTDLQEGVMKTRMQPIGNAWSKLPRLVRDLSHELGKKIELEMLGADTELDRQVLELIKDPLVHMVRNSADHGLEAIEERRNTGKREVGRITLNARHEGGHIVLDVGDDGRGLSMARIRNKVLNQGLASESELATMSERDLARFIFHPGFSTAAAITSVSGRGVGMDVVKTNIEKIGGTIELSTAEGRGTTFTIKIPLTLAIVSALIVESGAERFAVPQIAVVELVRVGGASGARIERIKHSPVMRLRDKLLPLVPLSEVLQLEDHARAAGDAGGFVVVTQLGPHVFGIVVDRVFDTEEIVVKPVAPILRHVTMFSGNTILGDGSVIMILDPGGVAQAAGLGADGAGRMPGDEASAAGAPGTERTVLVLFRAGDATPKAVPLGLVTRLEDFPVERIELSCGAPVVQYRDGLMTLVPLSGYWSPEQATGGSRQSVLVFAERDRSLGLMVDEVLDIVEERLEIQPVAGRPGVLGSAVIAGKVTDVIDCAHYLITHGGGDGGTWFGEPSAGQARRRVLLIEDSGFFRHLIVPTLSADGFEVVAVEDARKALQLREGGAMFDAIISDIELPGLTGLEFVRAARAEGAWAGLPIVALSGRASPDEVERGRAAGFTDYVAKYDREALLASLRQCVARPAAARLG